MSLGRPLSLNHDIIHEIIDILATPPTPHAHTRNPEITYALYALCLVNRAVHQRAVFHLYSSVTLPSIHHVTPFLQFLSPSHRSVVRSLSLKVYKANLDVPSIVLELLTSISLTLEILILDGAVRAFKKHSSEIFRQLELPSLIDLRLLNQPSPTLAFEWFPSDAACTPWPNVTRLVIHPFPVGLEEACDFRRRCPSLTEFGGGEDWKAWSAVAKSVDKLLERTPTLRKLSYVCFSDGVQATARVLREMSERRAVARKWAERVQIRDIVLGERSKFSNPIPHVRDGRLWDADIEERDWFS